METFEFVAYESDAALAEEPGSQADIRRSLLAIDKALALGLAAVPPDQRPALLPHYDIISPLLPYLSSPSLPSTCE